MQDENSVLSPPKRAPWNKGKLIGAKPPLLARFGPSSRSRSEPATWRCSISPSTASYAAAMSSP
jgi:hypothetical protein